MSIQFVLLPLFVEVLLTFGVMCGMMYFRTSSLQRGETRFEHIALREPNWPVRATQFGYAFANQFELPVLFYVLTILAIITHHADLLYVLLAWVFVVLRVFQVGVHVTNNNVRVRGAFYGAGALVLFIMWVIYIVRIVLALP
ncbi:MAG: MAPEG family protein [Pseudolabrys sp.]